MGSYWLPPWQHLKWEVAAILLSVAGFAIPIGGYHMWAAMAPQDDNDGCSRLPSVAGGGSRWL